MIHIVGLLQKLFASLNVETGISSGVLPADIWRIVSGSIVGNHYFEIREGLRAKTVERFAQVVRTVVNRQGNRNRYDASHYMEPSAFLNKIRNTAQNLGVLTRPLRVA
jgi:hypothetical protein